MWWQGAGPVAWCGQAMDHMHARNEVPAPACCTQPGTPSLHWCCLGALSGVSLVCQGGCGGASGFMEHVQGWLLKLLNRQLRTPRGGCSYATACRWAHLCCAVLCCTPASATTAAALMGPSGSGKSSLLSLLGGRSAARTSGSITFGGHTLSKRIKRKLGYVMQVGPSCRPGQRGTAGEAKGWQAGAGRGGLRRWWWWSLWPLFAACGWLGRGTGVAVSSKMTRCS